MSNSVLKFLPRHPEVTLGASPAMDWDSGDGTAPAGQRAEEPALADCPQCCVAPVVVRGAVTGVLLTGGAEFTADRQSVRCAAGGEPVPVNEVVDRMAGTRRPRCWLRGDAGMATVEYLIGLISVAALAMVLYALLTGDTVSARMHELVERALSVVSG